MLPPAPPRTEPSIQRCGRCTLADGAPPGSTIELRQGGSVIGRGEINRHGWTYLRVEDMPRSTSDLRARAMFLDARPKSRSKGLFLALSLNSLPMAIHLVRCVAAGAASI